MLSFRVFVFATLLVALLCVVLSTNAAPLDSRAILKRHNKEEQQELQTDSIPVSSDGSGVLVTYNEDDEVPEEVIEKGNSAQGDNNGL